MPFRLNLQSNNFFLIFVSDRQQIIGVKKRQKEREIKATKKKQMERERDGS